MDSLTIFRLAQSTRSIARQTKSSSGRLKRSPFSSMARSTTRSAAGRSMLGRSMVALPTATPMVIRSTKFTAVVNLAACSEIMFEFSQLDTKHSSIFLQRCIQMISRDIGRYVAANGVYSLFTAVQVYTLLFVSLLNWELSD